MKSLFYLILCLFCANNLFAQDAPDPANDNGWTLSPNLSDEFTTGLSFDETKWTWSPYGYGPTYANYEYQTYDDQGFCYHDGLNVLSRQTEGNLSYLRLSVLNYTSSCNDKTNTYEMPISLGNIIGLHRQQYGYFEIKFRVSQPQGFPANTNEGLSANAWLFRSYVDFNNIGQEIDLCEMDCENNRHTSNTHFDPHENKPGEQWSSEQWPTNFPHLDNNNEPCYINSDGIAYPDGKWKSNSHTTSQQSNGSVDNGWHVYSVKWTPQEIIIYRDGVMVTPANTNDPKKNPTTNGCPGMQDMNWIVGPGSGKVQFSNSGIDVSDLPFHMDVDYIRTYQLDMDCNTIVNDCSFWFGGYDEAVKKSIRIGYGGCGNSQPASTDLHLRATDYIELYGDFTVPLGAEMTAEIVTCY